MRIVGITDESLDMVFHLVGFLLIFINQTTAAISTYFIVVVAYDIDKFLSGHIRLAHVFNGFPRVLQQKFYFSVLFLLFFKIIPFILKG